MSEAGSAARRDERDESNETLRAKYLDYCSAQVTDILLLLSPDEMYLLAQDAARTSRLPGELSYEQIVQLATERLSSKLSLPPFDIWLDDYRANPDLYDRQLLGFWEGAGMETSERGEGAATGDSDRAGDNGSVGEGGSA